MDDLFGWTQQGVAWRRKPFHRTGYAHYELLTDGRSTGVWVRWCGHPTATYKYWVQLPRGAALGERAYRHVAEAKAVAEAWYAEHAN